MAEYIANPLFEEAEKPIDYKYYFFLFKKNFYIVLTFFIITVTLATVYVAKIPNRYTASSQIIVEAPRGVWTTGGVPGEGGEASAIGGDYYSTQLAMMKHATVIRWVVEDLKLKDYFEIDDENRIVGMIRGMVRARRIGKTRLFKIVVTSTNPKLSANLANSIARGYIQKNFEDSLYYRREVLAWLPEMGGTETDIISIEDPFGNVREMTRAELIENLPAIKTDETIRTLMSRQVTLEAELETLLRQYREKHPTIVKARANLKFIAESIEAEKLRILEELKKRAEI